MNRPPLPAHVRGRIMPDDIAVAAGKKLLFCHTCGMTATMPGSLADRLCGARCCGCGIVPPVGKSAQWDAVIARAAHAIDDRLCFPLAPAAAVLRAEWERLREAGEL